MQESAINDQINMELYASYAYQAAARNFERDDVALFGFAKFFQHQSGNFPCAALLYLHIPLSSHLDHEPFERCAKPAALYDHCSAFMQLAPSRLCARIHVC